ARDDRFVADGEVGSLGGIRCLRVACNSHKSAIVWLVLANSIWIHAPNLRQFHFDQRACDFRECRSYAPMFCRSRHCIRARDRGRLEKAVGQGSRRFAENWELTTENWFERE